MNRLLRTFALSVLFIMPSLKAQNVVDVRFGELYGNSHSTTFQTEVLSGTGPIGSALAGNTLYWVCLDLGTTEPEPGEVSTYTLLNDATGLSGGLWGDEINDSITMNSIAVAVSNMFSFYRSDLLSDLSGTGSNNTPGSAFQVATWYFTEAYANNIWSGTINQQTINSLLTWNGGGYLMQASTNTWLRDMLQASLVDAPTQQVFFANPTVAGMQPVALLSFNSIPVPEPGSAVLVGLCGMLGILRRRRFSGV